MKVNGSGVVDKVNVPAKKKKSEASGFGDYVTASSNSIGEESGNISNVYSISAASGLFSLQEIGNGNTDAEIIKQGEEGIELLARLQSQLLLGEVNQTTIKRMQSQLSQIENLSADNGRLGQVMEDIKLRLAVEIAKLEKVNS